MHPIELLRKLGWTYQRLAVTFGVSELEARRWGFQQSAKTRRNPSQTALILAAVIDKHPDVLGTIQELNIY